MKVDSNSSDVTAFARPVLPESPTSQTSLLKRIEENRYGKI